MSAAPVHRLVGPERFYVDVSPPSVSVPKWGEIRPARYVFAPALTTPHAIRDALRLRVECAVVPLVGVTRLTDDEKEEVCGRIRSAVERRLFPRPTAPPKTGSELALLPDLGDPDAIEAWLALGAAFAKSCVGGTAKTVRRRRPKRVCLDAPIGEADGLTGHEIFGDPNALTEDDLIARLDAKRARIEPDRWGEAFTVWLHDRRRRHGSRWGAAARQAYEIVCADPARCAPNEVVDLAASFGAAFDRLRWALEKRKLRAVVSSIAAEPQALTS